MLVPLPSELTPGTVIAHRGNRVAERENTLRAFRSASIAGATAVEMDVRRTQDGHLVAHHDAVIHGVGAIVTTALADLQAAVPWLPTLSEALDACDGMWVNIEIKNRPDDLDWDDTRSVAVTLGDRLDVHGVLISSFDWESVAAARANGFAAAYLVDAALPDAIERGADAGLRAVNPRASLLNGNAVAAAVAAASPSGMWILAWTVNDVAEARRLTRAGVHGIITDDPAAVAAALG